MTPAQVLALQRRQAKIGMSVALGALVATSLVPRNNTAWEKTAQTLHICAGVAMVGFSYWHWSLYSTQGNFKGRRS